MWLDSRYPYEPIMFVWRRIIMLKSKLILTHSCPKEIEQLALTYSSLQCLFSFKNINSTILNCNNTMRDFLGCEKFGHVIGKCDFDFHWADFAEFYLSHEQDALANKIYTSLQPGIDKNGGETLFMCHKEPYYSDGDIIGLIAHAYPIPNKAMLELSHTLKLCNTFTKQDTHTISDRSYRKPNLSNRERECLFFLLRGRTAKSIAKILSISPRTVEVYLDRLKDKLGCLTKNELIERAIDEGFFHEIPTSLYNRDLADRLKS